MSIEETSTSFFSSLASFILPTAHAEEGPSVEETEQEQAEIAEEETESAAKAEERDEEAEEEAEEEEEEDDPEDPAPAIRDACQEKECQEPAKHFQHCQEKVEAGKGWEGEDCVEELFHLMHCVDACAAPTLFKKLV